MRARWCVALKGFWGDLFFFFGLQLKPRKSADELGSFGNRMETKIPPLADIQQGSIYIGHWQFGTFNSTSEEKKKLKNQKSKKSPQAANN